MEVDDISDDASVFEQQSLRSQVIELRVGQQCFTTTRATLCKDADSMLAKMFSGELPPSQKDSSGRFFIDRDGSRFATILALLRGEVVEIPASVKERAALAADAAFYQVCSSLDW